MDATYDLAQELYVDRGFDSTPNGVLENVCALQIGRTVLTTPIRIDLISSIMLYYSYTILITGEDLKTLIILHTNNVEIGTIG